MDTDEFKRVGADLFGNSWQTRMARLLGVDGSSVRRWVGGAVPVPPAIAAFLSMMAARQEARGALVFHLQRLGPPSDAVLEPGPSVEHMRKKLVFPGVDQAKPMPAIHAREAAGRVEVRMDDGPADTLEAEGVSYQVTRHPDSRHLSGYLDAARGAGHEALTFHHRNHHYSLVVHVADGVQAVDHLISTHSGTLRRLTAPTADPVRGEAHLSTLPGADAGGPD